MTTLPRPAPDFALPINESEIITLSALRPAPVVLFFYPRDDTPGCTIETLAFNALQADFAAINVRVFGVSKDDIASHAKFANKHSFATPLLSDAAGTTCEDYGVWGEKKMYGKTFMGIDRSTFLIDGTGEIVHEWRKVKVEGHAEAVLEIAKTL